MPTEAKRKRAWQVLELAARIAQEDERAAVTLISAAASVIYEPNNAGYQPYEKNQLKRALENLSSATLSDIENQEREAATWKRLAEESDPRGG